MSSKNSEYKDQSAGDVKDNDYVSHSGQKDGPIPVQSDDAEVEEPISAERGDSDEQLAKDDSDAIDESNIIDERTRHAAPSGGYREPGDDEGLPGPEDGTSSGRQ